ncbi:MAG TPA: hypothetical protein PK668_18230 [Myxococcota bacterium]|nr:hypothetical protein [Myxococcota bacterium]HRY95902.1 hypothetical protein [Myxococcota bacterium]HSA23081.1 hypothetical protein [Myxococcota bacterium]
MRWTKHSARAAVLLGLALLAGAAAPGRADGLDQAAADAAALETRRFVAEARERYRAFELPAALERLEAARARWAQACPALDEELASAPFLLEGQVRFAAGERARALEAFGQAVAVSPALAPDPREWSPKLVAAFAEARAGREALPQARLSPLRLSPAGAELALDGRALGAPPGPLSLPPGDHCLVARAPGHRPGALVLRLAPGEERAVELALVAEAGPEPVALPAAAPEPAPGAALPALEPRALVAPEPAPAPVETVWYERWWVWTLVGAAVLGGAATALGVLLAPGEGDPGLQVVITRPPR